MKKRHWDTYRQVEVVQASEDQGAGCSHFVEREECTPFEWELLVQEAQTATWWMGFLDSLRIPRPGGFWASENLYRPGGCLPAEVAVLKLCETCWECTAVETEGTTEDLMRVRCLDCDGITLTCVNP